MRPPAAAILLVFLAIVLGCAPRTVPSLELARSDGSPYQTAEFQGRAAWLEFWSPWDPASLQRLRDLAGIVEQLPADREKPALVAVAVSATSEEIQPILQEFPGLPFTVVLDPGPLAEALGIRAVPSTVWVHPDGRFREVHRGYVEPQVLAQEIASALNEGVHPAPP